MRRAVRGLGLRSFGAGRWVVFLSGELAPVKSIISRFVVVFEEAAAGGRLVFLGCCCSCEGFSGFFVEGG